MPVEQTLVGRDRELAQLASLLADPPEQGWAVSLVGDPGVGKSALQSTLMATARERGHEVMLARGSPAEQHLAFAGLHQLVWPVLDHASELPTRQREALLSAFGLVEAAQPEPFLISLAALELIGTVAATAPVLVSIDDAHWIDRPTLDVITFIAHRLGAEPISILMSMRPERADDLDAAIEKFRVEALDEDAAADLLDREHPQLSPLLRDRVIRTAAGNPLALLELPIAAAGHGIGDSTVPSVLPITDKLERAFAERARQLPAVTLTTLAIAAMDDGSALWEILAAAVIVLDSDVTEAVLQPAIDARLVSSDGRLLSFRHPLVRSAIDRMSTREGREAAHAALATVLAEQPDRAVWHEAACLLKADEGVAARLEEAAARARQRGAVSTAVEWLERAAELSPDVASEGASS